MRRTAALEIGSQRRQLQRLTATMKKDRSSWKDLCLFGPSGVGKSVVAHKFALEIGEDLKRNQQLETEVRFFHVSWAALDETRLREELLWRSVEETEIAGVTDWNELNYELDRRHEILLVIVEDLELAFYNLDNLDKLDQDIELCQQASSRRIFFILTSQFDVTESLKLSGQGMAAVAIEPPKPEDCIEVFRAARLDRLASYLHEKEHRPECICFDPLALSLTIKMLGIKPAGHARNEAELTITDELNLIASVSPSGTERRTAFRKYLFEQAFLALGRPDLVGKLLCWAAVDPGFDYFPAEDVEFQKEHAANSKDGLLDFFFASTSMLGSRTGSDEGISLRLGHRSVLELYANDRILELAKACARHHEYSVEVQGLTAHEARKREWTYKTAALRHEIRTTDQRTNEQLERLESLGQSTESLAPHELAFAWADFASAFDVLHPHCRELTRLKYPDADTNQVTSEELGEWYQPPRKYGDSTGTPNPVQLEWAALNLADLSYQSLDQWDLAHQIVTDSWARTFRDLESAGQQEFLAPLRILRSLFAGAYVALQSDNEVDREGAIEFTRQQKKIHMPTAWDWNWTANSFICRIDVEWAEPAIKPSPSSESAIHAVLSRIIAEHDDCAKQIQTSVEEHLVGLEMARLGLCKARAVYTLQGWADGLREQETALALLTPDQRSSQEFLYGSVAAAYYALCGQDKSRFYLHLENAASVPGVEEDKWIALQVDYLKRWADELSNRFSNIPKTARGPWRSTRTETPFDLIGRRFSAIDDYSATYSYHASAQFQGHPIDTVGDFLRDFCTGAELECQLDSVSGDPYALTGLQITSTADAPVAPYAQNLDYLWFSDEWRKLSAEKGRPIRPLMTGVQIFQLIPPSFSLKNIPGLR